MNKHKMRVIEAIKVNPENYVNLIVEGYRSSSLDFDEHLKLIELCNFKWGNTKIIGELEVQLDPIKLTLTNLRKEGEELSKELKRLQEGKNVYQ